MSILRRINAYVSMIRPIGPLAMGFSVILGETIVLGDFPSIENMLFGFLTSFLLTSASFVLNDYMDVDIDFIIAPHKPIPKGLVSKQYALCFGITLSVIGLMLPILLSFQVFTFALVPFVVSLLYNFGGKKTGFLGNMMVAFCVSTPLIFGALIVGARAGNIESNFVVMISLLIFLSNTGREITKGIADARGDKVKNVRSLALVYGPKKAAVIAAIFYLLTSIIGPSFFQVWGISNNYLILPIILAEGGFVYSAYKIVNKPSKEVALKVNNQINLWMILFLVALFLENIRILFI